MTTKEEAVQKAGSEFSYLESILKKSNIDYEKKLGDRMNES